jgi:hypothetical protein
MKNKIVISILSLVLIAAGLSTPALAAIGAPVSTQSLSKADPDGCLNYNPFACPSSPNPGGNHCVINDNDAGQNVGIGIRVFGGPPNSYQFILQPEQSYCHNYNGGTWDFYQFYVGTGYCMRWIRYTQGPSSTDIFHKQDGAGYVQGPRFFTASGDRDWSITAYSC